MGREKESFELPDVLADFLTAALARLREDPRIWGVAAGGSYRTQTIDEFSDLDLVVAVDPAAVGSVMPEREEIARRLGPLLAAFTGEHVGEPRLLICLYGPPLLHVDLKFVDLRDVSKRVEDPVILWEREGCLSAEFSKRKAEFPAPDLQWIEDRFWVWVHYGVTKIGRGELFEALDFLAFLRGQVLGPMSLMVQGEQPTGVRKLEMLAPDLAHEIITTLASYDPRSCWAALLSAVRIYRKLRERLATDRLVRRREAEEAAVKYLMDLEPR